MRCIIQINYWLMHKEQVQDRLYVMDTSLLWQIYDRRSIKQILLIIII